MGAKKRGRIGQAVAVGVISLFFVLLLVCIHLWGGEGGDPNKLTVASSILASTLSFFVLVYAVMVGRGSERPSERYRAKYRSGDDGTDGDKE